MFHFKNKFASENEEQHIKTMQLLVKFNIQMDLLLARQTRLLYEQQKIIFSLYYYTMQSQHKTPAVLNMHV